MTLCLLALKGSALEKKKGLATADDDIVSHEPRRCLRLKAEPPHRTVFLSEAGGCLPGLDGFLHFSAEEWILMLVIRAQQYRLLGNSAQDEMLRNMLRDIRGLFRVEFSVSEESALRKMRGALGDATALGFAEVGDVRAYIAIWLLYGDGFYQCSKVREILSVEGVSPRWKMDNILLLSAEQLNV